MKEIKTAELKGKDITLMERTNYCPIYNNGEFMDAIKNTFNTEGYRSEFYVKSLDKKIAHLVVRLLKDGTDFADVDMYYNTRSGEIRDDITFKLKSVGFSNTVEWLNTIKSVRRYINGLIRRFAEFNDIEYMRAIERGPAAVSASRNKSPVRRKYDRKATVCERKGFYRHYSKNSPNHSPDEVYYVRKTTFKF